jgi:hypothetical protein
MRDLIPTVSAASAGAVAVALLLACAADPSTGCSLLAGTVFASLTAAELKARIKQARPAGAPGHDDGGGMPASHATATSFASAGWALVLQPDAPRMAALLPLAALAMAALRVASQHHTPTQAGMGLILGFLLACSWVRFGAWLALAGLFMHRGRSRFWRQGVALAEGTALRVSRCLPLYLCSLYALLFALAGVAAAGFATGIFRFDMYLSTFRIEGDALADLPHRLLLAQHATWALPPSPCASSPAWPTSGFKGMPVPIGFGTRLEEVGMPTAGAGQSTVGPPLLIFVSDVGGDGDVLTMEAVVRVSELLASLGPALSEDLPLFATRPVGAGGVGLLSPYALFTAPEGRISKHIWLECDAEGCSTLPGALPGGARFRLTAEEVQAVMADPAGAEPASGSDAAIRSWLTAHCHLVGQGKVRCGPVSCCACDAPPAVGCIPLPLCREEEAQLVFSDVWAQSTRGIDGAISAPLDSPAHGARTVASPPASSGTPALSGDIGSGAGAESSDSASLASFERAKVELLQCTGAAARLFHSLLAGVRPKNTSGSPKNTSGSAHPTSTASRVSASPFSVGGSAGGAARTVAAVARLQFRCGAEEAQLCDGAAYAAAIEPSGLVNYEALVQQVWLRWPIHHSSPGARWPQSRSCSKGATRQAGEVPLRVSGSNPLFDSRPTLPPTSDCPSQARMHEEYMRLARTVTLRLEAFNQEQVGIGCPTALPPTGNSALRPNQPQYLTGSTARVSCRLLPSCGLPTHTLPPSIQASSGGSLRASAWGGPAFLGVDGERALFKMVLMIALSAACTAAVVGAAVGSVRLAVLALLAPVLAFPVSWLLYAGLTGQRTLGLAQVRGLSMPRPRARLSPSPHAIPGRSAFSPNTQHHNPRALTPPTHNTSAPHPSAQKT